MFYFIVPTSPYKIIIGSAPVRQWLLTAVSTLDGARVYTATVMFRDDFVYASVAYTRVSEYTLQQWRF